MDHFLFKVNVTWTSPFFVYTPADQWYNGITNKNDSVASFNFRGNVVLPPASDLLSTPFTGNGVKLFGSTNATYTTQVDDMASQPANPRSFNYTSGEIPSNLACEDGKPWGCTVMAEYHDLDPSVNHTFTLQSKFDENTSGDDINILGMQVLYDTGLTADAKQQINEVPMEDNRLVYAGSWQNITYDPSQYRISRVPGSTITFPFSGYAIYVWGTTDIFTSRLSVSLDGQTHDMPAPSSKYPDPYCLLWYYAGLDQTARHTVVVTNPDTAGLIIRGFTVIRLVDPQNPGDSVPPTSQPNRLSTGAIAGIVVGVVFILCLAVAAFFDTAGYNIDAFNSRRTLRHPLPNLSRAQAHQVVHQPPTTRHIASTKQGFLTVRQQQKLGYLFGQRPLDRVTSATLLDRAGVYGLEHRKPPLDLGGPLNTPQTERGIAVFVTAPSSSGHGQSGSERPTGSGSGSGSRGAMLDSEMAQTDVMSAQEHLDRSATPPPAYEYRAQPGSSASAPDEEEQERRRRTDEERRRRRDAKTASGSGLGLMND
ncbi:hypothetical protein PIIN_00920 [Serendipita indica DSM 11827]|uniref:Uncharacterized protein n=1 Tax=Serendipita indica (strain DSM 11827) TaxID=1109443 RepID=G4T6X8_SERID|nr:hypothetical protein PIIN_00920 [Serendipita indica DSM 11827]